MKQLIRLFTIFSTLLFAVNVQAQDYSDYIIENILTADQSAFKTSNTSNNQWHAANNNSNGTLSYNNGQLEFNVTNHGQSYQPQLELSGLGGKIQAEEYYVRFTAYIENANSATVDFICQDTYNSGGYFQEQIANIELDGTEKTYTLKFANKLNTNGKHIIFNVGHTNCKYIFKSIEFGQVKLKAPTFTKDLEANYSITHGKKLTLSVETTANPTTVTYQWYANDSAIDGATSTSYTVPTETIGDFTYYCVATNTIGSTNSTTATVSVKEPTPVNGVSLDKTNATIEIGSSTTLTATVSPDDAANKSVTWSSSNPDVATVSGGIVKAIAIGNATITVTTVDGGHTASCNVTVVADAGNWTETTDGLQYKVNSNELIIKGNNAMKDYTVSAGTITFEDFENKTLGTDWTIFGAYSNDHGTAQIQANPTDANNKALKYTTASHKSNEWLQFDFQLSNGTITENQTLEFDLYIANCNNYDPMKYKFSASGSETSLINRVADQQKNVWKTYSVNVPTGNNSFTLYIGGMNFDQGCVFYFDNFRLTGGQGKCDQPWADDKATVTKVIVREGVTSIGNNAFNGFDNITEVDIASTVQTIGSNAFTNKPTINFHSNPNTNTFGATRNLILVDSDKPYMSNNPNEYNSIHYYRTTTANYFTLVVPFDAEIPSGMKVYEMTGATSEAVSFRIVEGTILKNRPYLVWMETQGDFELATTNSVSITPVVEDNTKEGWKMTGSYVQTAIDGTSTNCYAFGSSDNQLRKYTKTLNVAPFRCYFTSTSSNARMAVNFDDMTTAINDTDNVEVVPVEVYNINGIRQNGMQKGLNIVRFSNGVVKSVIIK